MGCLICVDFKKRVNDVDEAIAVLVKHQKKMYFLSEIVAEEEIHGKVRLKIYVPLTENEASRYCVDVLSHTPNIEVAKLIC
jgi:hypothetical protein